MYKLSTRKTGSIGETIAANYLQKRGYKILTQNWMCRYGELDLVTLHNKKVVFVEVKYVTNSLYCNAVELFSYKKQRHLSRTVQIFIQKYPKINDIWQLDLICLTQSKEKLYIEHYENILTF